MPEKWMTRRWKIKVKTKIWRKGTTHEKKQYRKLEQNRTMEENWQL